MLGIAMKKLRIKIGSMDKDMEEIFRDPSKGTPGTHTHYVKSVEELCELLTPKRLKMLIDLISYANNPRTVTEVSRKAGRKQEAISRDAGILTKHRLIEKIKKGRTALLMAKYDTLEISLAE